MAVKADLGTLSGWLRGRQAAKLGGQGGQTARNNFSVGQLRRQPGTGPHMSLKKYWASSPAGTWAMLMSG